MPSVTELKAQRAKHIDTAKGIRSAAAAENRDLTDAEFADLEREMQSADTLLPQIETAERRATLLDRVDSESAALSSTSRPAPAGQPRSGHQAAQPGAQGITVHHRFEDDPCRGFASHNDFLLAVMAATKAQKLAAAGEHRYALEFLSPSCAAGGDEASTFDDTHGGFLVPDGFQPTLLRRDPEVDPMTGRTTNVPMTNPVVRIPARVDSDHTDSVSGGFQVYRRAESQPAPDSRAEFEQVKLEAESLFGITYATEEILQRSPISFVALINEGFNDEFTARLIDERLNGSGVAQFLGINNSDAMITQDKEAGQLADTIVFANIVRMRFRCWRYSGAIWMANHDCGPQLASLKDDDGRLVFLPSLREDVPDMLMGRPLIFTEYTNTIGDAGDLVLANWSQYLEGTFTPMSSAESIHVRFINHERAFKFWMENDGRPWWTDQLQPKNGANTLSPFVRLEARA